MNRFVAVFRLLLPLTKHLSLCSLVGLWSGAESGLILDLLYLRNGGSLALSTGDVFWISLMLAALCWLAVVFLLCVVCRYSFVSVALPALVNCWLGCFLTALLTDRFNLWLIAWLVGMIVGAVAGQVLCIFYGLFKK